MHRFAPNSLSPTHPEANKWLTQLMYDLKKMVLIEENYQPFTMEFLDEWTGKHHSDIESCADWESSYRKMVSQGVSDMLIPEHLDALGCFNQIVIDLKLIVLGHEPIRPFTADRIKEADKYSLEVHSCRKKQTLFYR